MTIINIAEAKAHLSRLIEMALSGKEVIIGKRNIPLVRLSVIMPPGHGKRQGGQLKGKIKIADDFDLLPDDIAMTFEGRQE